MAAAGTLVYVPDKALAWCPAELIERSEDGGAVVRLHTVDGQQRPTDETLTLMAEAPTPLQNVASDGRPEAAGAPDLTALGHLHEASILYNLRKRHGDLQPYTSVVLSC